MTTEQHNQAHEMSAHALLLEIEERIYEVLDEIRLDASIHAKQMLNTGEVARLTGYKESYIRKLVQQKRIPHYKPNEHKIFFDKAELMQWLKATKVEESEVKDAEGILNDYINN